MEPINIRNKNEYNSFLNLFKQYSSGQDFIDFTKKIVNTQKEILGIKVPLIKQFANRIFKGEHEEFYNLVGNSYEENLLFGFVLAKEIKERVFELLELYFERMDNWADVDLIACSLKFMDKCIKNQQIYDYFTSLLKNDNVFIIRFGIVTLKKYYLNNEKTFNELCLVKSQEYYVNMALAWAFSEIIIKNPQNAENIMQKIIKNMQNNRFVINKTISKVCDSYRVSGIIKSKLKEMRI